MDPIRINNPDAPDRVAPARRDTQASSSEGTSFERLLKDLTNQSSTLDSGNGEAKATSTSASEKILAAIDRAGEAQRRFRELSSLLTEEYDRTLGKKE